MEAINLLLRTADRSGTHSTTSSNNLELSEFLHYNGDPNNDAHPDLADKPNRDDPWARHGGDLQGIINNLDYIEDLGVTAIWNTPVVEDNDPKGSYHMYAASDVYQIDRRFGSNQTYKHLSEALKKRNMKLIMDYVVNHWKNVIFSELSMNNQSTIIGTETLVEPYRLGIIYTTSKPSNIFSLNINDISTHKVLNDKPDNLCCRSPRLSPNKKRVNKVVTQ